MTKLPPWMVESKSRADAATANPDGRNWDELEAARDIFRRYARLDVVKYHEALSVALEALEFFADPVTYEEPEPSDPITGYFPPYGESPIDVAREALSAINSLGGGK
jgi:hypothetical protein